MKKLILKTVVVLMMGGLFALSPGQATAADADNCGTWISCTGGCCDDGSICDVLCPNWIAAVCEDDQIYCVPGSQT